MVEDISGLPITCTSNEALLLFNKAAFSYITLRQSSLPELYQALQLDDSLVLAHCLMAQLHLCDLKPPNDVKVAPHLVALKTDRPNLTAREKGYIRSIQTYASGSLLTASIELENVLLHHPTDALALRIITASYIVLAEFERMRNAIARALPHWNKDMELYPFVLAFYAFSLEECNHRDKAEEVARTALAMTKSVPMAIHAISHVIEEERDPLSGVEFLTSTREDWCRSVYGCHITWHLTLYYLDLRDFNSVFRELDSVILKEVVTTSNLLDAASLLWRLNIIGVDPGETRWASVMEAMQTHIGNHRSPWSDAHIMMSLAHGKVSESTARLSLANAMLKSMETVRKEDLQCSSVGDKLGVPVCSALLAFGKERYSEVLSLLLPLRYDLRQLGSSWAQRQVLSTTIIQAAINAREFNLALDLVAELKALKPYSKCLKALFNDLKLLAKKL